MNLLLGIVTGGLIGWLVFAVLNNHQQRSLRASLFIGIFGGVLGVQLAPLFGATQSSDSQLNLFSLVIATASAAACFVIANMIASRRNT